MTLNDLNHDEKMALVALIEVAVITDTHVSTEELALMDEIVNELGEDTFHALAEEAEQRFAQRDALRTFLKGITRQEAREIIYGTVLAEAIADAVPHAEADFLDWLAKEWKINMNVEEA